MDLTECKRKNFITIAAPNLSKARSLLEIAAIKEEEVLKQQFTSRNINVYLPVAYEALLEVLEAFCLMRGYAVANHVCVGVLTKELYTTFDVVLFDRFRYARNGINYYGIKVDFDQGSALIDKIFILKREMVAVVEDRL